jgi:hypothetical protein
MKYLVGLLFILFLICGCRRHRILHSKKTKIEKQFIQNLESQKEWETACSNQIERLGKSGCDTLIAFWRYSRKKSTFNPSYYRWWQRILKKKRKDPYKKDKHTFYLIWKINNKDSIMKITTCKLYGANETRFTHWSYVYTTIDSLDTGYLFPPQLMVCGAPTSDKILIELNSKSKSFNANSLILNKHLPILPNTILLNKLKSFIFTNDDNEWVLEKRI